MGWVHAVAFTAPLTGTRGEFLGAVTTRGGIPALENVVTGTLRAFQKQADQRSALEYQFLTDKGMAFLDSAGGNTESVNLKHLGLPSALVGNMSSSGYIEEDHRRRHVPVITGYAPTLGRDEFKGMHWRILLRMDRREVLAPIRKVLWTLGWTGGAMVVPIFGLMLWTVQRIRREHEDAQRERAHASQAEASLGESEAHTRIIVETALDAIIVMDATGLITDWNAQAEQTFGWDRREAIGQLLSSTIIPPQHREAHERGLRHFLATGNGPVLNKRIEITACRRNGQEFPVELAISPALIRGTTYSFSAFVRDITERKQAEEELRQQKGLLQNVIDHIPCAVFWKDRESVNLGGNQLAARDLGFATAADMIGKSNFDLTISRAEAESYTAFDRQVMESGQAILNHEEVLTRPDGVRLEVLTSKVPLRAVDGKVFGVLAIYLDITTRKHMEHVLRESQQLFASAFDAAPIGMALLAPDGHWLKVNQALCDIVGYAEQEMLETTLQALTHPDDVEPGGPRLFDTLVSGAIRNYHVERRYCHKDGRIVHILKSVSLVRDDTGAPAHFIAQIQDITARQQLTASL